jgi:hypothetical protein
MAFFTNVLPLNAKNPGKTKKTALYAGFAGGFWRLAPYLARRWTYYTTVCGAQEPARSRKRHLTEQTNVYFQKIQKKLVKKT